MTHYVLWYGIGDSDRERGSLCHLYYYVSVYERFINKIRPMPGQEAQKTGRKWPET